MKFMQSLAPTWVFLWGCMAIMYERVGGFAVSLLRVEPRINTTLRLKALFFCCVIGSISAGLSIRFAFADTASGVYRHGGWGAFLLTFTVMMIYNALTIRYLLRDKWPLIKEAHSINTYFAKNTQHWG